MNERMKEWMKECLKEIIKEEFGMDGIKKEIYKVPEKSPDFLPETVIFHPVKTKKRISNVSNREDKKGINYYWTKEEDDFLRELYNKYKILGTTYKRNKEIIFYFRLRFGKARTKVAIKSRAGFVKHSKVKYEGVCRFDDKENKIIEEMITTLGIDCKSKTIIEKLQQRFGDKWNYKQLLDKVGNTRRKIRNNRPINRPIAQTTAKIAQTTANISNIHKPWTNTEDETILKEREMGNSWYNISRLIHRTVGATKVHYYYLKHLKEERNKDIVQVSPETSMPKKFKYMG